MAKEVNNNVQDSTKDTAEFVEDIDFATMLEEFESGKEVDNEVTVDGVIVEIKDDVTLVDVGKKSDGRLYTSEIRDAEGNLTHKVGDVIKVVITGFRNEKPIVSHKKAIKKEKVKAFIDNFNESENILFDAKVVGKNKGGLIVENSDGVEFFLPRSQVAVRDPQTLSGKTIKVSVLKVDKENESIIVSRKKPLDEERKRRKDVIQELMEKDEAIEGVVKRITTYGMFVDVGGADGLVHYSEISYKGPVNPSSFYKEGDRVLVKAIGYDKEKRHLSLSIKLAQPDPWKEIEDQLVEKDVIQVTVSNIEPYGAFVDLGNDVEGFLHISEISWDKNIKHPKDYISEGQQIDVEVIEIDIKGRRLRVSLKNVLPKPFDDFIKTHKVGDIIKGTVTTLTNFGAFMKIGTIEGLLHNEDASWNRNDRCKELFKEGDEVEVKIIKIDTENEKISLSRKELQESPIQKYAKKFGSADVVNGKILDIKDFGLFVELQDGVDALIRKEDFGSLNVDELKVGDEIEAAIVFIDEKKNRIRLSVKRLSKIKERETLSKINKDDKMTLGDIIKDQLK
ncbi:MAG: 30S ribosomal protein S1 [Campylobacteraceae bacterium]|jgi:small subunit ribosomal protein S1|nr:30S ribosomal protein S1 [Campylobacteraceae bacterium]